jgi:ADP-heptose:LPS heptosyltransferase
MKKKYLVIRFSSIGDIVLTSPLLRCLKKQVEEAEIHFVTKAKYRDLLIASPYIDKLHFLNDHFGEMLKILREENFDYVIDLHQNFRSFRIKKSIPAPSVSINKLNFRKWLLVNVKIDRLPENHIVERYLKTVSFFNVDYDGLGLDYFIPEGQEYRGILPTRFRDGYIAFIIGGTYTTKRLPAGKIVEICQQTGYPFILIGGEEEAAPGDRISKLAGENVLNLAGKTSINGSASLVKNANLVLTNDTGMMHIAAAFGKKILSFWGNTVPRFGMYPYFPHPSSRILEVDGLKCRPCSKLGFRSCPQKHFRCMNDLDTGEAVSWILANYSGQP